MAKTIKKEDINEKAIIASFLQDVPLDHESLVSENNENSGNSPAPKTEAPKDETRRRRGKDCGFRAGNVAGQASAARSTGSISIAISCDDCKQD